MHDDGVGQLLGVVAQDAHDRRDAGAGGDEQRLLRRLLGQAELTGGLVQLDDRARADPVHEVVADLPVRDGLHGDGEAAVGPAEHRGDRVGAPLADAVDVDADADVLPGGVRQPVAAGADDDARRVPGLAVHGLDPAAQGGAGAERVEQVEVVDGQQRGGHQLGQPHGPLPERGQGRPRRVRAGNGRRHTSRVSNSYVSYLCDRRESAAMFCSLRTKRGDMDGELGLPTAVAARCGTNCPSVAEQTVAAIVVEVPSYADAFSGEMGRTIENAVQLALGGFLELASEGGDGDASTPIQPALDGAYALGRGEARSGRSMDALLGAYRVGARVSWRHMADSGVRAGLSPEQLAHFAELVFAYIDQLSAASVAGHSDELATSGRVRERYRERLADLLLGRGPRAGQGGGGRAGRLAAAPHADGGGPARRSGCGRRSPRWTPGRCGPPPRCPAPRRRVSWSRCSSRTPRAARGRR